MPSRTSESGTQDDWDVPREVRKRMVEVARDLRTRSTLGEQELWLALRRKQLAGRKFRRQQPVGPFVLDFYCSAERLSVEVDGSIHDDPDQVQLDAERQRLIESLGIRFVRLPNDLVMHNLAAALTRITAAFERTEAQSSSSPLVGEGRPKAGERGPNQA
jgi:adenine-specific DNA-methyltransferase